MRFERDMDGRVLLGDAVPRFEDKKFITGLGTYTADVNLPGQLYASIVRSPHAHARILSVDTDEARHAPGVVRVLVAQDLADGGLRKTACHLPRRRPDGSTDYFRAHPGLASDEVRYVGDPVAVVIARTRADAQAAADLVAVDYDALPHVTSTADATGEGSARVWPDFPNNISNVIDLGDRPAVDRALAQAAHVVRHRFVINRVIAHPMEPRAVVANYSAGDGRYTLYTDTQTPHMLRDMHAGILGVDASHVRVIAPDVGGGFGMKSSPYVEMRLCLLASRLTGRPVKWVADRSESFVADDHGRDNVADVELALDEAGQFIGLRVDLIANLGAYLSSDLGLISTFVNLGSLAGVYRTPAINVRVTCVYTNTTPTAPYRGAGRPEATYLLEAIIDRAARQLGIDRVSLRRRNLIASEQMPFKTGLTFTYDCGEFERNMDQTLGLCDYRGFEERRRTARLKGRLRGLGIVNAIEFAAAGPRPEWVEIRIGSGGNAVVVAGTKNHGQGHETMYRQMLGSALGLASGDIRLSDGDTDIVPYGVGTVGSRSAAIAGGSLQLAANKLIEKGRRITAHILEAGEQDIEFSDGRFVVAGTDRALTLKEVAQISYDATKLPAGMEPGFIATGNYVPAAQTFPNGCHACEVEIDAETGVVDLIGYWSVEDFGTVVNPLILAGQLHGGIVQGIGQALMENIAYDGDSGQLLTGSLMDYALPRAHHLCHFEVRDNPVPTKANVLGIKGAGEAGTVGGLAVVLSAINDALIAIEAPPVEMPATSETIWRSLAHAQRSL